MLEIFVMSDSYEVTRSCQPLIRCRNAVLKIQHFVDKSSLIF